MDASRRRPLARAGFALGLGKYLYLLAATTSIAGTPASLRLASALAFYCGAIWMNTSVWKPTAGLAWFAPVFFCKLLVSHAAGTAPADR